MAEVLAAIAVIASIAQLADYGFKLSLKLLTFSELVSGADRSARGISSDVSLTSTVLKELCQLIQDDTSRVVSEGALMATAQTVKDCLAVFQELDGALEKSLGGFLRDEAGKVEKRRIMGERLKWPFKQQKMELLRSNLDRLKASLTLMLQVLSYARDVSNQKAAETSLMYQKHLIETLARSEREIKQKYNGLRRSIEYQKQPSGFSANINTTVHITGCRELGISSTSPPMEDEWPPKTVRMALMELSLCFNLLTELLNHHTATIEQDEDLAYIAKAYEDLHSMVAELQQEHRRFDKDHRQRIQAARRFMKRVEMMLEFMSLTATKAPGPYAENGDSLNSDPETSDPPSIVPISNRIAIIPTPASAPPLPSTQQDASVETATPPQSVEATEEEIQIIQQNLLKLLERGEGHSLERLDAETTEALRDSARQFYRQGLGRRQGIGKGILASMYGAAWSVGGAVYEFVPGLTSWAWERKMEPATLDLVAEPLSVSVDGDIGREGKGNGMGVVGWLRGFWPKGRVSSGEEEGEHSRLFFDHIDLAENENGNRGAEGDEDLEDEVEDDAIFEDLLGKWTNLPLKVGDSGDGK